MTYAIRPLAGLIAVIAILIAATFYWLSEENLIVEAGSTIGSSNSIVNDDARILDAAMAEEIEKYHAMMLDVYDIDYQVLTVKKQADINQFSNQEFNRRNVGSESKAGRGLLLVIDVESDLVRLEVGATLEGIFTDAFIAYVENRQMVPFFKVGRVATGVLATSELIRNRAQEALDGKEFNAIMLETGSIGGGAKTQAGIGSGRDITFEKDKTDVLAADTPEETLRRYFEAMAQRNARKDLDIFTPESRIKLREFIATPAQMDNAVRAYKHCEMERVVYNRVQNLAVLRYKLSNRECGPWFFEKGPDGKWRLDKVAVGFGVTYSYANHWFMDERYRAKSGIWKYDFGWDGWWFWHPDKKKSWQAVPMYYKWGVKIRRETLMTYVQEVHGKHSFAWKIGLRPGDVILSWDGADYPHHRFVTERMGDVEEGQEVKIAYFREGVTQVITVKAPPKPRSGLRWGLTVITPWPPLPLVHYVEPGSQAAEMGLQRGDAVVAIQGKTVKKSQSVYNVLKNARTGEMVTITVIRNGQELTLSKAASPLRVMQKAR